MKLLAYLLLLLPSAIAAQVCGWWACALWGGCLWYGMMYYNGVIAERAFERQAKHE